MPQNGQGHQDPRKSEKGCLVAKCNMGPWTDPWNRGQMFGEISEIWIKSAVSLIAKYHCFLSCDKSTALRKKLPAGDTGCGCAGPFGTSSAASL